MMSVAIIHQARPTHLLPYSSLATKRFIRIPLGSGLVDLDHSSEQLGLVHVVNRLQCIVYESKLDIAEASMRIRGSRPVIVVNMCAFSRPINLRLRLWHRNIDNIAKRYEGIMQYLRGDSMIQSSNE